MLPTFETDRIHRRVHVRYQDRATFEEWAAVMQRIFSDSRFAPGFDFIFDKRYVREDSDPEYAAATARFYHEHQAVFGRCAIVVGDMRSYALGRAAERDCGDSVRVFVDLAEALRWLDGVEPPATCDARPAQTR